jgi:hypothetical protein
MEITLAIVGTAGRKEDAKRLTRKHFEAMCLVASGLLEQINDSNYKISTIVSGGAAWADAVAVRLFLDKKVPNLRLFIPAQWEDGKYHDTGEKDPYKNPGGTANYYHKQFQQNTGINGLSDIQIAQAHGAELYCCKGGFHGRNAMVAKSDFILACTFGNKHIVKEGGTADTIRKYLDRVRKEGIFDKSFHYDLNTKNIYEGCQVPPIVDASKDNASFRRLQNALPPQFRGGQIIAVHSYPP